MQSNLKQTLALLVGSSVHLSDFAPIMAVLGLSAYLGPSVFARIQKRDPKGLVLTQGEIVR